ncbi:MAG: DNA repair protein RecO [Pseudomonadota bacterium]
MDVVEAFVLHARAWRESSQLVELLSVEHGRIGVLTRGNRGARRGTPLQPFRRYRIALSGRGELRRAGSTEALGAPHLLQGRALYAALYLSELLVRLLHRDVPVPDVVELYAATLDRLAADTALEPALRCFEKQLLDELGYGHRYGETVDGRPVAAGELYTFEPERGVRPAMPGSPAVACHSGRALLALERGDFTGLDADVLQDAKRLMREALAPHLGDRPLQSRALFRRPRPATDDIPGE